MSIHPEEPRWDWLVVGFVLVVFAALVLLGMLLGASLR